MYIFTKKYVCISALETRSHKNCGSSREIWSGPRFLQLSLNEYFLYQLLWLYHSPLYFLRISLTLSLMQWFNQWHLVTVTNNCHSFFHYGEYVLSLNSNMNLCHRFIIVGFSTIINVHVKQNFARVLFVFIHL